MSRSSPPSPFLRKIPVVLAAAALYAQTPANPSPAEPSRSIRLIPALSYGPNVWSILRLTNQSASAQSVRVDVFRQSGDRLPIGPDFHFNPGERLDVRIESPAASEELGWATVAQPSDGSAQQVSVRAFVEVLNGNQIADFEREIHEPSPAANWAIATADLRDRSLYFLNASEVPTVVTFCAVRQPRRNACQQEHRPPNRFPLAARQAMVFNSGSFKQKYLMIESSRPGSAVMVGLADLPGRTRVFSSQSSITFGQP